MNKNLIQKLEHLVVSSDYWYEMRKKAEEIVTLIMVYDRLG
jgi:hypothetical protein